VISWFVLNLEYAPTHVGRKVGQKFVNLLTIFDRIRHRLRQNSIRMSRKNIAEHYDLGNEFYTLWLDPTMAYSSARFTAEHQSLEQGQISKFEALCRKLQLKPTDHLLEIGTGWGGFSLYAAKHYGCRITTITISNAQFVYAQERMRHAGLADRVTVELKDYRQVEGKFDKIVSIEMMEALGNRFLETYCARLHRCLKGDGLVGLQYITVPDSRHAELRKGVDWIQRHIFPGSLLLSIGRVNQAMNRTGNLYLYSLEDMGASYAKTLRLWRQTFNREVAAVRRLGFPEAFIRKWNFYLAYCEAGFAMKNISVVQAIYTRPNNLSLP
jgi:cyclopropane-fatty-acyl-phospholipid synthase